MTETDFSKQLKKEISSRFPGCFILKNDPSGFQGIPDLIVLWKDKWATLESKSSKKATHRPNQDLYVKKMNDMSFSSFIYPENKEEVLDALSRFFQKVSG